MIDKSIFTQLSKVKFGDTLRPFSKVILIYYILFEHLIQNDINRQIYLIIIQLILMQWYISHPIQLPT